MAYSTEADIKARFPEEFIDQLTDDSNSDPGATLTARINAAIADADDMIDSYVGVKYLVPLATANVTQGILNASARIAIYYLASRRLDIINDENNIIAKNHSGSIKWLKDVSTGKAILKAPPPEENSDRIGSTSVTPTDRIMSNDPDSLGGLF